MDIKSAAFNNGERIPAKYTCKGENIPPPLDISGIPAGAKSLTLIVDDPDAPMGTWVHWVIFNIKPETTKIERTPAFALDGMTDFRRPGYGGPCPPPGNPHRYYFKLYALDSMLNLAAGSTKEDLEEAMRGHILAEAKLMGTFSR